jgi:hypothetical protein
VAAGFGGSARPAGRIGPATTTEKARNDGVRPCIVCPLPEAMLATAARGTMCQPFSSIPRLTSGAGASGFRFLAPALSEHSDCSCKLGLSAPPVCSLGHPMFLCPNASISQARARETGAVCTACEVAGGSRPACDAATLLHARLCQGAPPPLRDDTQTGAGSGAEAWGRGRCREWCGRQQR